MASRTPEHRGHGSRRNAKQSPKGVETRSPSGGWASSWLFAVKIAFTALILVALVRRIDLQRSLGAMRDAVGVWLLLAAVWHSLALVISTLKWDVLLRDLRILRSRWELLRLYMIGFFANSFLPGVVGGDVVRWYLTGVGPGVRMRVAATIVAERVTGVITLVGLSALCVLGNPRLATPPVLVLLGTITGALIAVLVLGLNRRLATRVRFSTRRGLLRGVGRRLHGLHRTLHALSPRALAAALGWSAVFYLACGLTLYMLCLAFEVRISPAQALSVQLLVSLVTLIPVSIGGLGLTQAGDVYMFGLLGVEPSQAFAISILRQLINFGYRFWGGILFLQWKRGPAGRTSSPEAETEVTLPAGSLES